MPEELKTLKNLITKKPRLQEIRKGLELENNDQVLFKILDLLEFEVNNLNLNSDPERYKYFSKCFIYFNYNQKKARFENENIYDDVFKRLNVIRGKIDKKLENKGRIYNYRKFTETKEKLLIFNNKVDEFKLNKLPYLSMEKEEYQLLLSRLTKHLLFEVKDVGISLVLINNFQEIREVKYAGDKTILSKIFENYLNSLKNGNNIDVTYYDYILKTYLDQRLSSAELKDVREHVVQLEALIEYGENKSPYINKKIVEHLGLVNQRYGERIKVDKEKLNTTRLPKSNISYSESCKLNIDVSKYEDMRDKHVFTIDSVGCKKKEDAIHISDYGKNGYEIIVFISDVAELIIDDDKYFDRVISMLSDEDNSYKHIFSKHYLKDRISLEENKDRYTIAFKFKFDNNLEVISFDIGYALINVNKNFYDGVTNEGLQKFPLEDNIHIRKLINLIAGISFKQKNPGKKIPFCKKELLDALDGYPTIASGLLSEINDLLNYNVAKFFEERDLPIVYRKTYHKESPKINKLLKSLNLDKKTFQHLSDNMDKPVYKELITSDASETLSKNETVRCTMTNPARDSMSLINQMILKDFVLDNNLDLKDPLSCEELQHLENKYSEILPHISKVIEEEREIKRMNLKAKKYAK